MPKRHRLMLRLIRRTLLAILPTACGLMLAVQAEAGVPVVSGIMVTDVTPRSFAVVWESSEPATGSLLLFRGDCTTPVPNPLLTAEQSNRTGIIRVTVAELDANTSYCYQTETTSNSSPDVTIQPAQPVAVKTHTAVIRTKLSGSTTIPLANDLLRVPPPYQPSLPANQEGILALVKIESAPPALPLSLLLTADETGNYFNLNNLFDPATAASLNLTGGERARITERHGLLGCRLDRFRTIPADQELTREASFTACANPLDIDCSGAVTVLDILRVTRGSGTTQGDNCFNSDLDRNADGKVDLLDVEAEIGGFDATF